MAKYAAALDQGTTSSRAMIFDHSGRVVAVSQKEHEQIYPKPGWVEHDPKEIWDRSQEVLDEALSEAGASKDDIAALGITNQRETAVVWDRTTGEPIHNAIVWQDTRTDKIVDELGRSGDRIASATSRGCRWPPTSPGRRSAGSWRTLKAPVRRPMPVTSSSAISTPG